MDKKKTTLIEAFNTKKAEESYVPPAPETLSKKEVILSKANDTPETRAEQATQDAKDKAQREEQEKNNPVLNTANQLDKAKVAVSNAIAPTVHWMSSLPTPGGIATILLILVFFVLAVIPVDSNGNTRLKLIWLSLTGKTAMRYTGAIDMSGKPLAGGGTSGGFSATAPTSTISTTPQLVPLSSLPTPPSNGVPTNIDIMSLLGF